MNPAEWLLRAVRLSPEATALLRGEEVVADYAGFARRAAAIGGALRGRLGVAKGDRVALFMTNRTEYLEAMYGALFAGAAVVPINAKLHVREAAWILEDSGAKAAIASRDVAEDLLGVAPASLEALIFADGPDFAALREADPLPAPEPVGRDEMIWLFYTSGTTGRPKGVMIPAGALEAMALSYFADVDEVRPGDAILYAAPMSHGAGIYNFMHVMKGARHVVAPSGGFDPDEILDLAPRLGHVHFFAAPTMVRRLTDRAKARGLDGEGIRTVVYGGGPMYVADIEEAVEVFGPRFVQIYGQGECPMCITVLPRGMVADRTHPRWRERLASIGYAQSVVRVRVVDGEGRDVAPGEVGEIVAKGAPVMLGYWKNPKATEETIRDGWLWTGDMGTLDAEGFVTLRDRSKDMIVSGGTNIYPREVEEALLTHASVHECAVVGRKHPEWGEEVVAFVVTAEGRGLEPAALDRHCLDLIARFKRPKDYFAVEALPKNNYGKVLKTELRRMLESGEA